MITTWSFEEGATSCTRDMLDTRTRFLGSRFHDKFCCSPIIQTADPELGGLIQSIPSAMAWFGERKIRMTRAQLGN